MTAYQFWNCISYITDNKRELVIKSAPDFSNEFTIGVLIILMYLVLVLHHVIPVVGEDITEFSFYDSIYIVSR